MELILIYRELYITPAHIAKYNYIFNGRIDQQNRKLGTKILHIG